MICRWIYSRYFFPKSRNFISVLKQGWVNPHLSSSPLVTRLLFQSLNSGKNFKLLPDPTACSLSLCFAWILPSMQNFLNHWPMQILFYFWLAPRLTQAFTLTIKWEPGILLDLVLKSKLSLSGYAVLRQLSPIHKMAPKSLSFYSDQSVWKLHHIPYLGTLGFV